MKIYKLSNQSNFKELFSHLDIDGAGANILSQKSELHHIFIKDLKVGGANILKQEALSIGADLAVPRGTILASTPLVDCVLIVSNRDITKLSSKLKAQPFGLKELSSKLLKYTKIKKFPTKIMGVINANDDSFFSGSRFSGKEAFKQIQKMIDDGADIIDIGGVSSRPGSKKVKAKIELERVSPIIDLIYDNKLYKKAMFSIDSYEPKVIKYALKRGFKIVNDITGLQDDTNNRAKKIAKLCAKYDATLVIMHMQGSPQDMQDNPSYENVVLEVDEFFEAQIQKAKSFGVQNIALDVGIGFGKTLEHNLELLRNLSHFGHFGYELLIGASRKSMIQMIMEDEVLAEDRLSGTLAIHLEAIKQKASIIRCHDVKEHFQAIKVQSSILEQL